MTLITRDADASPDTSTLVACPPLGPLVAGEALDALAPCYIKSSDGLVYMSNATGTGEASEVAGFTMKAYASGAAVTLYGPGVRAHYAASGLTPGDILYVGATAGRLDSAPTAGDQVGVAQCISATDIVITRAAVPQVTSPVKVASAALAAATGAGGILAWANPEGATIIVLDVVFDITTQATGAANADVGVAANGSTSSDTIMDGVDVGTAPIVANNQNNAGTNGGRGRKMTSSQFITATGSADPAGLVGTAYITYILA